MVRNVDKELLLEKIDATLEMLRKEMIKRGIPVPPIEEGK